MKRFIVYQIDAFTKQPFKGNPAGVVVNADGLDEQQMQHIARELNNSETAFLFSPDSDDCDGVIRSKRAGHPGCWQVFTEKSLTNGTTSSSLKIMV